MVGFRDVYDVSARQKKIIEEKAARRIELRNEYLRKYLNPYKPDGGMMFDEPIQRLISLRETRREFNKPTVLNWLAHIGMVIVPFTLLVIAVKRERDAKERQYRTGQIAYKDRFMKFA
ncbi:uncharacterized protein LOC122499046 [Leptopilina heterotoma]|uniref:uncharacterized protein LOC122499046 n=1 Tax=Leptopilina heterotoma TaxID=63436 RepID=UPI001CA92A68|nr:uncharacterized protein LOC122499046 [Leptopilina heterotoma]